MKFCLIDFFGLLWILGMVVFDRGAADEYGQGIEVERQADVTAEGVSHLAA
jgi:hypothetical protein